MGRECGWERGSGCYYSFFWMVGFVGYGGCDWGFPSTDGDGEGSGVYLFGTFECKVSSSRRVLAIGIARLKVDIYVTLFGGAL